MKHYDSIWLDMDGVLVDLIAGAAAQFGIATSNPDCPKTTWNEVGCGTDAFWAEVERRGVDFWKNLPPFETNVALVRWARAHADTIGICSAPPRRSSTAGRRLCYQGKIDWLHQHGLGDLPMMFTRDKYLLAKPGALLVDDVPENCRRFADSSGESLLFPGPWNQELAGFRYFDLLQLS